MIIISRLKELEEKAIETLKFFEPLDLRGYYLAYSGGKDSDVILALAKMADVKFDAVHNLTTVDAPETVYHVMEMGVSIEKPDRSMWQLILEKKFPPTRISRYCCSELKERGGQGRTVVTGVRKYESVNRAYNGGLIKILGGKNIQKQAEEKGVSYYISPKGGLIINNNDNGDTREFVEHCSLQAKVLVNPIVEWTDSDVWEFIKHYKIKVNPLYQCGWSRIGCIGCPMASKSRYKEFFYYPQYKNMYIKTFDKMVAIRREYGLSNKLNWQNGIDVFRWWMEEEPSSQIRFSDLIDDF